MPETVNLLEKALENEAKKFMSLVTSLEGDELYMFIRSLIDLKAPEGAGTILDIVSITQNVVNIEHALDDFYVA